MNFQFKALIQRMSSSSGCTDARTFIPHLLAGKAGLSLLACIFGEGVLSKSSGHRSTLVHQVLQVPAFVKR